MLIYVSKTEGQGSSSHKWSALLLLPSVSPAIASAEEQEKTWKKYEWSWSCLTLGVTLCTILIFKGAFICGSHPPPHSLTLPEQLVSWLWQGGSNTAPAHWDAAQEMVNARSILWRSWVCADIVVPCHSADPNGSIFVCFIIHLLLDTAKTIRPNGIWVVQFSADFGKPYLSLFQAGLLQRFPGNPSASVAWLPKSLLVQPSHRHGAESGRSVPSPKRSNWFSSSLKQCWALSGMFLCGTKSSSARWITY